MLVDPLAAMKARAAALRRVEAAERAADRAAVAPLLAALLAGEQLTAEERGAVVDEVLRGWRAAPRSADSGHWARCIARTAICARVAVDSMIRASV
jgi:hypothetical protein